jgi:hypothetical protein
VCWRGEFGCCGKIVIVGSSEFSRDFQFVAWRFSSSSGVSVRRVASQFVAWRLSSSRGISVRRVAFQFVAWRFSLSRGVSVRRVAFQFVAWRFSSSRAVAAPGLGIWGSNSYFGGAR